MDDKDKSILNTIGDAFKSVVDTAAAALEPETGLKPKDQTGTAYANYTAPTPKAASGPNRAKANKRVATAAKTKAPAKAAKKSTPKKTAKNAVKISAPKKTAKTAAKKTTKKKTKKSKRG
jgi:hypothetical protein